MFKLEKNADYGSIEITFDGIPEKATRDALKALKFRWHAVKKVWYGYATEEQITAAIENGKTEAAPKNNQWLEKANRLLKNNGKTFDGYLGAIGWAGCERCNDIVLINKEVKQMFKALYPGLEIGARCQKYSGGQSTTFTVKLPLNYFKNADEYATEKAQHLGRYNWINKYDDSGNWCGDIRPADFNYDYDTAIDLFKREYSATLKAAHDVNQYYIHDDSMLNDDGKKAITDLKTLVDAYNYDDSNGMVDYFNTNFYSSYRIQLA